jgi:glutathionylspermidine synthase
MRAYVRKPIFSREGANILLRSEDGSFVETGGSYGRESFIYQKLAPLPSFDDMHPVIGSWVIDGESAGIGIRETTSLITDNTSRFVPHLFR